MTPERFARIRRTLQRRQTSLTVLMENVHKAHNYSAILRSCDAVGVFTAHAISTSSLVQTHRLTSASADKWVHVEVHPAIGAATAGLKKNGFRILAAHLSDLAAELL